MAKALMTEALKRLEHYNPILIAITGAANTPSANRLYDSMGFINKEEIQF